MGKYRGLKKWMGAAFAALSSLSSFAHAGDYGWRVTRAAWAASDEKEYSSFIASLGQSGCNTIDKCLKSAANPFRASDPAGISFHTDCADLPYVLRAYFSWKKGLPFSYVSEVDSLGSGGDIRYSPSGNRVTKRHDVTVASSGNLVNALTLITSMRDQISTAMYRMPPTADGAKDFPDFYPVALNRQAVVPGVMVYDPNGHVAIVYKVEDDGRLLLFDAHPDNSITHITYGAKFVRSRPSSGAGFKAFRPLHLVNATSQGGLLLGGTVAGTPNAALPNFSTVQFFGTHPDASGAWQKGTFVFEGQTLDYYDYLRHALAVGELRYHPVEELDHMLDALCQDLQDRVLAVQLAIFAGQDKVAHPARLPLNIYGTDGDWETYASPSRDARLKASFLEARQRVEEFVTLEAAGNPAVDYSGHALKTDLLAAYRAKAAACRVQYVNSDGKAHVFPLSEMPARLFKLSFDPYHCVEKRWGATAAAELASCEDNSDKSRWYDGEQGLRNQIDRTYDAKMDFSREELFTAAGANRYPNSPDVDLAAYLQK